MIYLLCGNAAQMQGPGCKDQPSVGSSSRYQLKAVETQEVARSWRQLDMNPFALHHHPEELLSAPACSCGSGAVTFAEHIPSLPCVCTHRSMPDAKCSNLASTHFPGGIS